MSDFDFDVLVIGAGITGLIAARHVAGQGFSTASCEGFCFGGLVTNINDLAPGLDGSDGTGVDVASQLMTEVSDLGVANLSETVTRLAREGDGLRVSTDGASHRVRAVIIATGARVKALGVTGEEEFLHRGVSQCADCDGPLFAGDDVVVVGGGDSALQEALVLAAHCGTVHLVHRGAQFRARQAFADAIAQCANVQVHWNTVVTALRGGDGLESVAVRAVDGSAEREIPARGFFAYPGLQPNSEWVPAAIERDASGFLHTDTALQTAFAGVFAAGAVRAGFGGQLAHARADGLGAASAVTAHLRKLLAVAG